MDFNKPNNEIIQELINNKELLSFYIDMLMFLNDLLSEQPVFEQEENIEKIEDMLKNIKASEDLIENIKNNYSSAMELITIQENPRVPYYIIEDLVNDYDSDLMELYSFLLRLKE